MDEFGIWPYDRESATAFFTLVSARYERGSIILTSNKGFGEWGELLGGSVIASAVLDRLLHHSHVLNIRARAIGSERNVRRGYSRRNNTSAQRRRRPATTIPTDRIAGQRHYKRANSKLLWTPAGDMMRAAGPAALGPVRLNQRRRVAHLWGEGRRLRCLLESG